MFQHPDTGYHQTKLLLLRRMQSEKCADEMFNLLRDTFNRAMIAEGVVVSRAEQSRMLRDMLDDLVTEILKKL
jgi:hypothetical protein